MSPRIAKEIRPLAAPALIGLACAITILVVPTHGQKNFFLWLAWMISTTSLAAASFAVEGGGPNGITLIIQPISRGRIWWEKYRVLIPTAAAVSGVFFLVSRGGWGRNDMIGYCSIAASLASAPYWAKIGRTTLGTTILSFGSQFAALIVGVTVFVPTTGLTEIRWVAVWSTIVYSCIFLALGWRRHVRAEQIESNAASAARAVADHITVPWIGGISPRHRWKNLLVRELNLHRTSVGLGAFFVVLLLGLQSAGARWSPELWAMLTPMAKALPFYMWSAVTLLFTTAAAFNDEKELGTHALNLALPVAARKQFAIKLLTAGTVFLLIGIALPVAIARITHMPGLFLGQPASGEPVFLLDGRRVAGDLTPVQMCAALLLIFALAVRTATLSRRSLDAVLTSIGTITLPVVLFVFTDPDQSNALTRTFRAALFGSSNGRIGRSSPWWVWGETTDGGDSPAVVAALALCVAAVLWLLRQSARDHAVIEPAFSRWRSFVLIAGVAILPVLGFNLARALEQQVVEHQALSVEAFQSQLTRELASLVIRKIPLNQQELRDFTLGELKSAGWSDRTVIERLKPEQRITARIIHSEPEPHGTKMVAALEFVPEIRFPENRYRAYQTLRSATLSWIEVPDAPARQPFK
jgi:hypothetical protein